MIIKAEKSGTVENLKRIIDETVANEAVKGIMILACDANGFTPEAVDDLLTSTTIPVLGGIFPELIHGQEKLTKGNIVVGLLETPNVQIIPNLSDSTCDYDELIDQKLPELGKAQTMVVLVDGLSTRISAFIDSLFNIFGLEINFVGGGAGSLSLEQMPCLFSNEGLIQDSAILALLEAPSGIGVSHGWHSISGPFQVTEVERNVIKSLNWQPALDVYRQVVEQAAGQAITQENFFDIAKGYPFGINRASSEKIVRDPIIATEDGALVCVGEVPSESYVDILSGDVNSLVNAAAHALELSRTDFQGNVTNSTALFFDCISRVLFLEDEFDQELQAVVRDGMPVVGALTLGEIANNGDDYLEFYNKTAVIAVLN
ncbi:FIST signal transduction protein [Candidatus Leptofilum sp.]|uniref:FIST signal transduction protein n=1 Tax=Candidatus Leptofilum sp. TaxID=3241576 RepID=UPI003B5CA3C3